ncbi:arginine--tRNA ligase [[Mycoplasma] collis]|uniref:arginine--tRNA ligase n=1 Tax=[Mycoplasma] collis TaxID=2127 RepID=UPI00051CAC41|nr:arginine--tRNA ligase [[Mycoplasma] collis]
MNDNLNLIISFLNSALNKLDYPNDQLRLTKAKNFGDFSTNIALVLQKQLNKKAMDIAYEIKNAVNFKEYLIKKIEIVEPGFLNFFVENEIFSSVVKKILDEKEKYGSQKQNQKINIEFVSVNPTGFLHVGHARGAVIGSTLANILLFTGNKVIKEYYVNDAGNQIDILANSVLVRYKQLFGMNVELETDSYHGEDIIFVAQKIKDEFGDLFLKITKDEKNKLQILKDRTVEILLNEIKKDLQKFNVEFDIFYSERELYKNKIIEQTLEKLDHKFEKEGALWLETTKFGDDKDRVLIKKDKTFTYFTPDIAYHQKKINSFNGVDKIINIWGADHIGYVKRLEIALEILGFDVKNFNVLICQIVRFFKDGQIFKMSKRKGTSFTVKDILKIVNEDMLRFFMINRSENSTLDFNIDLAVEQNNKNPVYLIQYSYARICQLFKKNNINVFDNLNYEHELEIKLINILKEFPELIDKISKNYKVNLLPEYLITLARNFNSLYENIKFIGNKNEMSLLALAKATQIVLKIGLDLIGVNSPERM